MRTLRFKEVKSQTQGYIVISNLVSNKSGIESKSLLNPKLRMERRRLVPGED